MYLIYSKLFGLREVDRLPEIKYQIYMRDKSGNWRRSIINKNKMFVGWIQINKCDLPKELLIEALILNIPL